MNERIKELARMSGFIIDKTESFSEFAEKTRLDCFAELIVRECIGCCEQVISDPVSEFADTWLNGGSQCIQEIKQHFGYGMSVADKKQLIVDLLGVNK